MFDSDAPTEADSERDGLLSYAAEWHAFTHGLYAGVTTKPSRHLPESDNEDVQKEPHYYKGAYLIGTSLQLVGAAGVVGVVTGLL